MSKLNKIFFYPSSLVLILVNLIPLAGVLYFGWDVFTVIVLYWMESAVVGFFNVLKMQKINKYKFTPLVPAFIVHYAVFMLAHLFLIISFFQPSLGSASNQFEAFALVFGYFRGLFISLSFIFLSHGMSYVFNFIQRQEFLHNSLGKQAFRPYKRIFVMHFVVTLGGLGIAQTGYDKSITAIVILVLLKIIFDLIAHISEHRKNILT